MRVLFTCAGEYGHMNPLLPVARSVAARGHEVAFAVPESFRPRVEEAGFSSMAAGLDRSVLGREIERRFPEGPTVPVDERLRFALANVGARIAAPVIVPELVAAIGVWHAELLVHGPADFAGPIAAEVTGIPRVNHGWGQLAPLGDLAYAADAVAPLWRQWSLDPQPMGGMFRYLYLDICPPALQSPEIANVEVAHLVQPAVADLILGEGLPDWVGDLPDQPTVYVTLGTFCNRFTRLFSAILDGLREAPVNVIVTVGRDQDPAALGAQPSHVHVVRYIPMSLLMPHCRLVVSHGGSQTTLAALRAGVPLLIIPQGHDHLLNATRCAACGAGRFLPMGELSGPAIGREVATILGEPGYRHAAEKVQRQIAAMPAPDDAVALLEQLAREQQPLGRSVLPQG